MPESLTAPAPAKVNLILEVIGPRPDGFHEIDTIVQTLKLADTVTLVPGASGIEIGGPFAGGTPSDSSNLAIRALDALRELSPSTPGFAVCLEKRIPAAGGLGGGASDAATALRLAQRYDRSIPTDTLLEAANAVGSDEAALLLGGTVRARGRGDRAEALVDLPPHGVVLFLPSTTIPQKTARMFTMLGTPWDTEGRAQRFAAAPPPEVTPAGIYNAFERVAFEVFDGLAALRTDIERRTGESLHLAGAGPALFWIGPPGRTARVARAARGSACTVVETATARSLWRP